MMGVTKMLKCIFTVLPVQVVILGDDTSEKLL